MNNATLETMTAERDSLRAAFIRYIALDQFISNTGFCPDDFNDYLDNMQDALHGGAMQEVVNNLSSSIEDAVFDTLAECEIFREAE